MTKLSTIVWLAVAASAVPLFAIYQQYHVIIIEAAAEDDCADYYGVYALDEVERNGDHVNCIYR